MDADQKAAMDEQHTNRLEEQSAQVATQMAAKQAEHTVQNPRFLQELKDADVDSDVFDWISDELGPLLSGAHILGNRGEHYEEQQELLNKNKVERLIAEGTPGRLLRENPAMAAQAQGVTGWTLAEGPHDHPDYRPPLASQDRRVLRDLAEVLTTRETLAIEGRGLDAVATATVENRTVSNEESEQSGVTSRAKEVFR
jgi:hypothetical protein